VTQPTTQKAAATSPLRAGIAQAEVWSALYRVAFGRTRHQQNADDIVQSTVERALAREKTGTEWKGVPPPLLVHLGVQMQSVLSNFWRGQSRRRRREIRVETDDEKPAPDAASETPTAEELLTDEVAEERRKREEDEIGMALRAHFAALPDGQVPLAMLAAWEEGIEKPAKVAARIGCGVEVVYEARRRIERTIERIVSERGKGGAPR
jgi:DNA-directed RNA polymerase specialized sigma24 family protein